MKMLNIQKTIFYNLAVLLLLILVFLSLNIHAWIFHIFGKITIEQILFTLSLPLKGADAEIVKLFIKGFCMPSILCSFLGLLIIVIIADIKYFNKYILKQYKKLLFVAFGLFVLLEAVNFVLPLTNRSKFYFSYSGGGYK